MPAKGAVKVGPKRISMDTWKPSQAALNAVLNPPPPASPGDMAKLPLTESLFKKKDQR